MILRCANKEKPAYTETCKKFFTATNLCMNYDKSKNTTKDKNRNTTDEFYFSEDIQKGTITSVSLALVATLINMVIISIAMKVST